MTGIITSSGDFANGSALATFLALCTIDLYQNNITPSKGMLVTDLDVATFTGYTQQVVTAPAPPIIDTVNGGQSIIMPSHVFAAASPYTVGNTVYGWYLRTAGGVLVAAGKFATPISVGAAGQAVPLQVTLNIND